MYTITVLDTAGIQSYVFNSNELKHIIGASWLVHAATHDWVYDLLNDIGRTNVDRRGQIDEQAMLENGSLDSELIYAGGGNTLILFRTRELAEAFTRQLSYRALTDAPGLNLVLAHQDFDWQDRSTSLADQVQQAIQLVNKRKMDRPLSMPVLGLGVTADCQYTGLPAVDMEYQEEGEGRRISAEIKAKLAHWADAEARLKREVPATFRNGREFRRNFEAEGQEKRQNYIAVVHTDGNGMGQRFQSVAEDASNRDNRRYIRSVRKFSASIDQVSLEALRETVLALSFVRPANEEKAESVDGPLPVRPIVFGGDDATFVCAGWLGLFTAQIFLEKLMSTPLADGKKISARAGVSIIKSHFPFSRAYLLSEALADSAKKQLNALKEDYPNDPGRDQWSVMDWHFSSSGPVLPLDEIRQREFTVEDGKLNMRPVCVGGGPDWHTWERFVEMVYTLRDSTGPQGWNSRRNQVMALREIVRSGGDAVKQYRQLHHLPLLPGVPGSAQSKETGWTSDCCAIFDAIEALDFLREPGKEPA